MVGTQDYQAPELCASEARASQSSDLWAYGCVLYQMITGSVHSPYQGVSRYTHLIRGYSISYGWAHDNAHKMIDKMNEQLLCTSGHRLHHIAEDCGK